MTYVSCLVQTLGPWSVGSISLCSSALFSSRPTLLRLRLWLAKTGSGLDPSSLNCWVGPWPETLRFVKVRKKTRKRKIEKFWRFRRFVVVVASLVVVVAVVTAVVVDAILRSVKWHQLPSTRCLSISINTTYLKINVNK